MTQTQKETRTRTFSWTSPAEHAALLATTGGLELLRGMAAGELPPPPIMSLIDLSGMEVEEGSVTFYLEPQEFHYNPLGTVHGGVISTLLDSAAACSLHSTLPAGVGYTSLDLMTRFIKPVTVDSGVLRCEGAIISRGRRTAVAESHLYDESGKLLAHATSTCLIFDLPTA